MLPLSFDPEILSSLPEVDEPARARVTAVLVATVERRVLPYLTTHGLAETTRLARAAERYRIERLEDGSGELSLVSVLTENHDEWVLWIHERIFDYVAFGIGDDGDAMDASGAERRKVLALAELVLRHEMEHVAAPERSEIEVLQHDLEFLTERARSEPAYVAALREVLDDETNGLRGERWLTALEDLDAARTTGWAEVTVSAHADRVADLPPVLLTGSIRAGTGDDLLRLMTAILPRLEDRERTLRLRAEDVDRIGEILAEGRRRRGDVFTELVRGVEAAGATSRLATELGISPAAGPDRWERAIGRFQRSATRARDAETWRRREVDPSQADPDEPQPRLDGPELMGEPPQRTLEQRIEEARANPSVPRSVLTAIDRNAKNLSGQSKAKYIEFVETLLSVPWGVIRPIDVGPREFWAGLESTHHGLARPKDLVADFFSNLIWRYRRFDPSHSATWTRTGSAFLFVGPPGVGKTSLAISIARSLGIPFHKISLGGMRDESDLRGHGFTYEGSKPGGIVQGLIAMGVMNGMFILDEADKTEAFAIATLLEILDPEQNHLFHDRYTQTTVDVDLSNCHFILTANTLDTVPPPVVDRCQVVRLDRYSVEEKVAIARDFLIPRLREHHALPAEMIDFEEDREAEHLRDLIRNYTHEAGVRQLALVLRTLFLRVQRRELTASDADSARIDHGTIRRLLEEPRRPRSINDEDRVGEILGLGVDAERGIGEAIPIQATRIPGLIAGDDPDASLVSTVHATGNLEKVMDESRRVATTGILHCADALGLEPRTIRTPVHLHFLGASTRKDGPSAGCAIALALTSLLTGRKIRRDVAVTGEIDTQGRVTNVGGIDIKLETAVEAGCTTLVVPRENLEGAGGLSRLPEALQREIQIFDYASWARPREAFDARRHVIQVVGVEHVTQAADICLLDEAELEDLEQHWASEGRRMARDADPRPERSRCPMVVVVKDPEELPSAEVDRSWCDRCSGCKILVPAEMAGATRKKALAAGAETWEWSSGTDPAAIVGSAVAAASAGGEQPGSPVVVAPFFVLREGASELAAHDVVGLANNYALQGFKLRTVRRILDAVYCRLLHLGERGAPEAPFLGQLEGITVLDLSGIPEKYRLEARRADAIASRLLGAWLEAVDETWAARWAS